MENQKPKEAHEALEKARQHVSNEGEKRPFKYYVLGATIAEHLGSIEILKVIVSDIRRDSNVPEEIAYADFYDGMIAFREKDERSGSFFKTAGLKWKDTDKKNYARALQLRGLCVARDGKLDEGMLSLGEAAKVQGPDAEYDEHKLCDTWILSSRSKRGEDRK